MNKSIKHKRKNSRPVLKYIVLKNHMENSLRITEINKMTAQELSYAKRCIPHLYKIKIVHFYISPYTVSAKK